VEWPEPDAVVVRDVFPAVVRFGPSTLRSARAVVTRERVYVWTSRGAPAVNMAYDSALSTVPRINDPRSRRTTLILGDGSPLTIELQRGCGCGNPLKAWTPWRPYRKGTALVSS
jgi:hypothetical protein